MATDETSEDSSHFGEVDPSSINRRNRATTGTSLPHIAAATAVQEETISRETATMATMMLPLPSFLSSRENVGYGSPHGFLPPSQHQIRPELVELPSIRDVSCIIAFTASKSNKYQLLPEMSSRSPRHISVNSDNSHYTAPLSPTTSLRRFSVSTVQAPSSPSQLKRPSEEEETNNRYSPARTIGSPSRSACGTRSPTSPGRGRQGSVYSSTASYCGSSRASPGMPTRGLPGAGGLSPHLHLSRSTSSEWRPSLPSLPAMVLPSLDIGASASGRRLDKIDGFRRMSADSSHLISTHPGTYAYPGPAPHSLQWPYTATGNPSSQPHPHSSSHTTFSERTPFSSNGQHSSETKGPYSPDTSDLLAQTRQRKRRGNLPKETTDKLRSWFLSHLTHPYPTEEEKQELMKKTGLQMSMCSILSYPPLV